MLTRGGTDGGWMRRVWRAVMRRPWLVALSSVVSGAAGVLIPVHPWVGVILLVLGGVTVGLAEAVRRRPQRLPAPRRGMEPTPAGPAAGVWNVSQPSRTFAGRRDELTRLETLLSRPGQVATVALHGIGGVGKTQLAQAYAHERRSRLRIAWWLDASSDLTAEAELAALAEQLGVGGEDQDAAARSALLELARRTDWLLVYDGAERVEDIAGLLPDAGTGQVIITSRYPAWDAVASCVALEPFRVDDAIAFLMGRTGDTDRVAAAALAAQLSGLPLALEQAAAYCQGAGITLAGYRERYRTRPARLLRQGTLAHYDEPVVVTWRLAFQQATKRQPAAGQLLRLLAYLAPSGLGRDLLASGHPWLPPALARAVVDDVRFDAAIAALGSMSLLTVGPTGQLRTHHLVQEVQRDEIDRATARPLSRGVRRLLGWLHVLPLQSAAAWPERRWAAAAVALLVDAFGDPALIPANWDRCGSLLPHARLALGHAARLGLVSESTAALQHRLACYLTGRGELRSAQTMLVEAVETLRRLVGDEHPDTLAARSDLAICLHHQGDLVGARRMHEAVYEARRRVLPGGEYHPATLWSRHHLARIVHKQGDLAGAERRDRGVLEDRTVRLGPDHGDTLASLHNLARVQHAQGHLAAARADYERVVAIRDRDLGPEHPETLAARNNLARVQHDQGELREAEAMHEAVLAARQRCFGQQHPNTLWSQHNLARVRHQLGELAAAREIHEHVLTIRRRILGARHPETLWSLHNLAQIHRDQGDLATARDLFTDVLTARRRMLGDGHPDTLDTLTDLAGVLDKAGDPAQAQEYRQQCTRTLARCWRQYPNRLVAFPVASGTSPGSAAGGALLTELRRGNGSSGATPAGFAQVLAEVLAGRRPGTDGLDEAETGVVREVLARLP